MLPIAIFSHGNGHNGLGWYYCDQEYPDEGGTGSFQTKAAAIRHAKLCGYTDKPEDNGL